MAINDPRVGMISDLTLKDADLRRMMESYKNATISRNIPTTITLGNETINEQQLSTLLDMSKFMQYLIESDPAMKERFTAFRTMQKILK